MKSLSTRLNRTPQQERGAVLIVALLFSAIVAISLTSYIRMSTKTIQFSQRSFASSAAIALVDSGLEQAMWTFNQVVLDNKDAWNGWDISDGVNAKREFVFDNAGFSQNTTAIAKVTVENFGGTPDPRVIARAIVTLTEGPPVEKWVLVELKNRSPFGSGMVARKSIKANGDNIEANSWDSHPDPLGPRIPYAPSVANDNCTVGSVAIESVLNAGNADLFGYAAVGGPSVSAISIGAKGLIGPFGTASGVKDPERISSDFTTNLDIREAPSGATWLDPVSIEATTTLSTPGTYYVTHINLNGNQLIIDADITLIVNGEGAITIGGGAGEISVAAGAALKIYTDGNIAIGGKGIANASYPEAFQIWGTSTSTQKIAISGGASLSGVIYAPNADVDLNGGGKPTDNWDVFGSIVADTITLNGNVKFHYDENLKNFDADTPYGITKWRELTKAEERSDFLSKVNF